MRQRHTDSLGNRKTIFLVGQDKEGKRLPSKGDGEPLKRRWRLKVEDDELSQALVDKMSRLRASLMKASEARPGLPPVSIEAEQHGFVPMKEIQRRYKEFLRVARLASTPSEATNILDRMLKEYAGPREPLSRGDQMAYHVTPRENLEAISRMGLVPRGVTGRGNPTSFSEEDILSGAAGFPKDLVFLNQGHPAKYNLPTSIQGAKGLARIRLDPLEAHIRDPYLERRALLGHLGKLAQDFRYPSGSGLSRIIMKGQGIPVPVKHDSRRGSLDPLGFPLSEIATSYVPPWLLQIQEKGGWMPLAERPVARQDRPEEERRLVSLLLSLASAPRTRHSIATGYGQASRAYDLGKT